MKHFFILLLVSVVPFVIIQAQPIPRNVPTNGLVGWWPFSGNANDVSGNGNNGVVNGPSLTTDRFGNPNAAYNFNGLSDYITCADSPSLDVDTFTISVWAKLNTSSGAPDGYLVTKGCEGSLGVGLSYRVYFEWTYYTADNWAPSRSWVQSSQVNSLHQNWTHVVYTYDGSNNKVYIDGQFVNSKFQNGTTTVSTGPLLFGAREVGPVCNVISYLHGKIDDIGIWNRVLSPIEISWLYKGCTDSINLQPANQTLIQTSDAQFTTSSTDSAASYQWQTKVSGIFQDLTNTGQYSGTTDDTLVIRQTTVLNNGQILRCIVSSGPCGDTTNTVILTVNENCVDTFEVNPMVQFVYIKSDARFIASPSDTAATYQWQIFNSGFFQDLSNAGQYSGTNDDTLLVKQITLSNHGQRFRCKVLSGSCEDSTEAAMLFVLDNTGTGVNEPLSIENTHIYPNPSNGSFTIDLGQADVSANIKLLNLHGQILLEMQSENRQVIEIETKQSKGIYFIQLSNNQGTVTKKMVIE